MSYSNEPIPKVGEESNEMHPLPLGAKIIFMLIIKKDDRKLRNK